MMYERDFASKIGNKGRILLLFRKKRPVHNEVSRVNAASSSTETLPDARNGPKAGGDDKLMVVRGVERVFHVGTRKLHVLKGIDMEIEKKQLVMLKGRSGSGKTTLLNLIGGLDQPTRGEIYFKGNPFHEWSDQRRTLTRRKEIGFIFQTFALMPLLSAWENVELSLAHGGISPFRMETAGSPLSGAGRTEQAGGPPAV